MGYCSLVQGSGSTLYTGWIADLSQHLAEHDAGRDRRYARSPRSMRLAYCKTWEILAPARQGEIASRRLNRTARLRLIQGTAVLRMHPFSR